MTSKDEYINSLQALTDEYHGLSEADEKCIEKISNFISRAYAVIWDNCSDDSPHLMIAKKIIDSDDKYWNKAQSIQGIITALNTECEKTGYFTPIDENEHYKSYGKFSSAVRNWLIAYGVAGPALLLAEENMLTRINESNCAVAIGILFLGGVLFQVLKSLLYKATSWYAMDYKYIPEARATKKMKYSLWINNNMWIDMLIDLITILMFIAATVVVLNVIR